MKKETDNNSDGLHSSIVALKEWFLLHPADPIVLTHLAQKLSKAGRDVAAIMAAKKAYLILNKDNPVEAGQLVEMFGDEVADSGVGNLVSRAYLPLVSKMNRVARNRHTIHLPEGGMLFQQGDAVDSIYLVLDGELAVNSQVDGMYTLINYLQQGCLVSKSAGQGDGARSATVIAMQPSTVLRFNPHELDKAFTHFSKLRVQFGKESMLCRRVEILSSVALFARLPMDIRFILAKRSWSKTFEVGETIKNANALMPQANLIISGVVYLYDNEPDGMQVYCGRLAKGALMGMHKRMNQHATSLIIKAETDVEVVCLDFVDIEDVMEINHEFRNSLMEADTHFSEHIIRTILLQKSLKKSQ